jgi:hypothetical protein
MPKDIEIPEEEFGGPSKLKKVKLPSGSSFELFDEEVKWWTERVKKYTTDFQFTNVSDLQDLDNIMISELLIHRWGSFISKQEDFYGNPVPEDTLQKAIRDHIKEIRLTKKALGMDRIARERETGESSIPAYLDRLREKAKAFGVLRNKQHAQAMEAMNDIKLKVQLYYNTDEREKNELDVHADDVLVWLRDEIIPKYDVLDEYFRNNPDDGQKMWIRKL